MSSMGKLNNIWRGLSRFLSNPIAPVTKGWALILDAIPPEAMAKNEALRDAVTLFTHISEGMVDFLKLRAKRPVDDDDDEPAKTKDGQSPEQKDLPVS